MKIVRYYPRALTGDGGMTNAVKCWSKAMVCAGAKVTIVHEGETLRDNPDSDVAFVGVPHLGGERFKLARHLDEILHDADVLVLHSAWALHNVYAAAVARRLGVPYVLEPRGAYDPRIVQRKAAIKNAWWTMFERSLVMDAAAIHLFFDSEREHLAALGYRGNVIVAPNGVSRPSVHWDGGSAGHLLWMGRFDPEHKGIDILVEALALIAPSRRPTLRLHGPDFRGGKRVVADLIRTLGLDAWCSVEPSVHGDAKFELVARSKGFVYPSRWEGFGNSTAEAVAIGTPTLTTPYPLGRYLASRGAAIVAEPNSRALAAGLEELLSPRAAELGAKGRAIMEREFTWDAVAQSWLRQAEAALRGKSALARAS